MKKACAYKQVVTIILIYLNNLKVLNENKINEESPSNELNEEESTVDIKKLQTNSNRLNTFNNSIKTSTSTMDIAR